MSLQQALVSAAAVVFARAHAVLPLSEQLLTEEQNQRPNSFNQEKHNVQQYMPPQVFIPLPTMTLLQVKSRFKFWK